MANALTRAWRSMFAARRAPDVTVDHPRLGVGGPPAGLTLSPYRGRRNLIQDQQHPIIGADVGKIHSIITNALDRGEPQRLHDLYDDMLDRDDRVYPVVRNRMIAILTRPYSVKPPEGLEDDSEANEIAQRVGAIITAIKAGEANRTAGGWSTVVGNIADAVAKGYSVNEIEWHLTREGYKAPRALHWRHPNRFIFGDDFSIRKKDRADPKLGVPLENFGEDKFVIHSPVAGRPAYPTRRGILLPMVLPSLGKRYGIKWWLKAVERWGQPLPYATVPVQISQDQAKKQDIEDALNDMAANWNGVFPEGVEVKVVEQSGNVNPDMHNRWVELNNTAISIIGLGQNLSTEVKEGSFAAARIANLIRLDLLTADLAELDGTITSQIIEPIVRYNWPGAPVPQYKTEIGQQQPFERDDVKEGLATANEYRAGLGHGPMGDGQGEDFREPLSVLELQSSAPAPAGTFSDTTPPVEGDDTDPLAQSSMTALTSSETDPTGSKATTWRTGGRSSPHSDSTPYVTLAGWGRLPKEPHSKARPSHHDGGSN